MRARPVVGVIVAHADLAEAMVRAVEGISGVGGGLLAVSNARCTPETLRRRVQEAIGDRPAVIFVDLASGSCAFAGQKVAGELANVSVVTGVNLPMLLDFVFHRDMPPERLAERVVGKGRNALTATPGTEGGAGADRPDPR